MLRVGYYVERPNERNNIVGCVHLVQLDYLYSGWGASLCFSRLLSRLHSCSGFMVRLAT